MTAQLHAMQFSAWRVQQQTALYSVLLPANPSIQRNLRMMSVQDQEETPSLIHGGAPSSVDRVPGCHQGFKSSLIFYRDSMSDIAVGSTSLGTMVIRQQFTAALVSIQ